MQQNIFMSYVYKSVVRVIECHSSLEIMSFSFAVVAAVKWI